MKNQQRSWANRVEEVRGDWPFPDDQRDIIEFWKNYDENEELDDHGNPIVIKGPRPWGERMKKFSSDSSPEVVQALLRQPFPSVLLGAALCAGQPYLLWNIQMFLNAYLNGDKTWVRRSCGVLINRLRTANGAVVRDSTTTDVLFHLVVEPFALMYQMKK